MLEDNSLSLDMLVQAVQSSPKYRRVTEGFIRSVGKRELAKRRRLKEAIKATKNKLHQIGGAYLDEDMQYAKWLVEIETAAATGEEPALLAACRSAMQHHSSTRERLEILPNFYRTVFSGLPPIRSVLDIACGLNPLAFPWMPLAEDAHYYAVDIYDDMVEFVNRFFSVLHINGVAEAADVIESPPERRVDIAFVLKAVPCLEQVDRASAGRLLDALNADYLLVSFPIQSLGGRQKGMTLSYENRFQELAAGKNWSTRRFEFPAELAFLVKKL